MEKKEKKGKADKRILPSAGEKRERMRDEEKKEGEREERKGEETMKSADRKKGGEKESTRGGKNLNASTVQPAGKRRNACACLLENALLP